MKPDLRRASFFLVASLALLTLAGTAAFAVTGVEPVRPESTRHAADYGSRVRVTILERTPADSAVASFLLERRLEGTLLPPGGSLAFAPARLVTIPPEHIARVETARRKSLVGRSVLVGAAIACVAGSLFHLGHPVEFGVFESTDITGAAILAETIAGATLGLLFGLGRTGERWVPASVPAEGADLRLLVSPVAADSGRAAAPEKAR